MNADRWMTTAYRAGWSVIDKLPEGLGRRGFRFAADIVYRRDGKRVQRLRANLRRVVGPEPSKQVLDRLTRAGMRSYLRYWYEVFRMTSESAAQLSARFHVEGAQNLDEAYAAGKGVILALPHMGNWDHAGAWLVDRGMPFATVNERLKPEALYEQFVAYRESLGFEILPLTGGERPPFAVLAERLHAGQVVCLVADRDLSSSGIEVDFFGAKTRMPAGPAALHLRTGAPVLPVAVWYDPVRPRHTCAWVGKSLATTARGRAAAIDLTQQIADAFATQIARHPADWHMLSRLWLDDLDPQKGPEGGEERPA